MAWVKVRKRGEKTKIYPYCAECEDPNFDLTRKELPPIPDTSGHYVCSSVLLALVGIAWVLAVGAYTFLTLVFPIRNLLPDGKLVFGILVALLLLMGLYYSLAKAAVNKTIAEEQAERRENPIIWLKCNIGHHVVIPDDPDADADNPRRVTERQAISNGAQVIEIGPVNT